MDGNAKVFAAQEALQQIKQLLAENQPFPVLSTVWKRYWA